MRGNLLETSSGEFFRFPGLADKHEGAHPPAPGILFLSGAVGGSLGLT
jgi:hypothetical protein